MYQRILVASITFSVSVHKLPVIQKCQVSSFGIVTNLIVLTTIRRMCSMSCSFGIITKNQTVSNIAQSAIFLFYVCPLQFIYFETPIYFSRYLGVFVMAFYEVSIFSHFLMACNRFFAVFLPFYYESVFSTRRTKLIRNILWLISFSMCIVFYKLLGCHFLYHKGSWTLVFRDTDKCDLLTWYSDFTLNTSLVVVTFLMNVLTALKAKQHSEQLVNAFGNKLPKSRRNRELIFIRQAFFQGTLVLLGQLTFYIVAPLFSNLVVLSFLASVWAFMQSFEGGIILASNHEIRSNVIRKKKPKNAVFVCTVGTI